MIEKLSLFNTRRDFSLFLGLCILIFSYSFLIEYNNYKNLTKFDSQLIEATVLKQYEKTKLTKKGKLRTYQVLKLKSHKGFSFYTTAKKSFENAKDKKVTLVIFTAKITFYEYLTSFFVYSKILHASSEITLKEKLNTHISDTHTNEDIQSIYKALYSATPLDKRLQTIFSQLGISHLFAISGFHLGVLSGLLFFLFKSPYKYLQNRYFPYRSYKLDSFIVISFVLLSYLLFLDTPASLLRAFVMLVIGFILYDRGYKIISMWTLFLTAILILSFNPRLFFSIGFWLSISGVFYIFLFLIHFKHLSKTMQFLLVPIWVYLMMLPLSLYLFESFSIYHPLSILWTSLFTLFYPLSIVLHFIGLGDVLDNYLIWILNLSSNDTKVVISWLIILPFLGLSFLSVWRKVFVYLLLVVSFLIFIYAIYNVT